MNPSLFIFSEKIEENAKKLKNYLSMDNIDILGVTKVMLGDPRYAKILIEAGIETLGDSRIQNIIRMRRGGIKEKIFQIRSPQISEAKYTFKYADGAFITEIDTLKVISNYSKIYGKKFGIIVMVELGDLREGVMPKDLYDFVKESLNYKIEFLGIGTNLGCFGGVIPTEDKMNELSRLKEELIKNGIDVKIVSGGATDTLYLYERGRLSGINQLRIGEAIALGRDTTGNREISYLNRDTFLLKAEIIEIKEKPSKPYGEIGRDAFGNIPKIMDIGLRKRAIIALGIQDVDIGSLIPLDKGIRILGGSSDHIILDITESEENYAIGSEVEFHLLYPGLLKLMTSHHVKKVYKS